MADHSLIKHIALDQDRIDYGAFTLSLIQEARRVGMLNDMDAARIENELLSLLRAQIVKITHGESSSVPESTADELMDGIGYCIDLALKSQATPADGINLLKNRPVEAVYQIGADILDTEAKACVPLPSRVRATRTRTVNEAYRITLDSTLPGLLRAWQSSPFPHDFMVITEYPLACENGTTGIFAVHDRLSSLALENRFCAHFSDGLERLLEQYAHQSRVSPADAYANLFLIALRNLLLNLLLGRGGLELDAQSAAELEQKLLPLQESQRQALIKHAADLLLAQCAFENPKLDDYVRAAAADFADDLNTAGGRLEPFAVLCAKEPEMVLADEETLNDEDFALLADEILICETVEAKIRILHTEVHSLTDLVDLLAADCIFEEEYPMVFDSFEPSVQALLLSRMPFEDAEGKIRAQREVEWQLRYASYLNRLPDSRRDAVLRQFHALGS